LKKSNEIVVAVKRVILFRKKMLIIQRAFDDEVGGGTWECPGGKIDFGEELETALAREVKEEVGLKINVTKLLYASTFKTNTVFRRRI
jgi:8-oxo-dGTP diphosphatase